MSRAWNEFAAALFDVLSPGLALLLLLLAATVVAALWYWYPAWVPRRLPRPRRTRKGRPAATPIEPVEADVEAEPTAQPAVVPSGSLTLADRLAAEGRYAEAIRERLRAVVGDLVAAGVVTHDPAWTVTEVAAAAGAARPAVAPPLEQATGIFSTVWYGRRPAHAAQDEDMKQLTGAVRATLRETR